MIDKADAGKFPRCDCIWNKLISLNYKNIINAILGTYLYPESKISTIMTFDYALGVR